MRLIGFMIGFALLLLGVVLGGELGYFLDQPTLLIVFGGGFAFAYSAHGSRLWQACGHGLLNKNADTETYADSAHVLQTLRRAFLGVGIITALIGAINLTRGLDDWSDFSPAFSTLLLAPLYGVFFAELVAMPAVRRLQAKASP